MSKNAIQNAETIIERFGGIRPMAAKINVAVTTIQGWKKRGVIPAKRRDEILQAAENHNIDVQDLLGDTPAANENKEATAPEPAIRDTREALDVSERTDEEIEAMVNAPYEEEDTDQTESPSEQTETKTEQEKITEKPVPESIRPDKKPADLSQDAVIKEALRAERASAKKTSWITTAIVLLGLTAVLLLLWPQAEKVEQTAKRLSAIEANMNEVKDEVTEIRNNGSFFGNLIPSDLEQRVANLQQQAEQAQEKIGKAMKDAEALSNDVLSENAGTIEERIEKLEQHATVFAPAAPELTDMVSRLSTLHSSLQGQTQLDQSVAELNALVGNLTTNVGTIDEALGNSEAAAGNTSLDTLIHTSLIGAQQQSDTLGQTFEGVPPENMKAAAILLGFSQLRSALNRDNKAFNNDLELLSNLIGNDNPELQAAITQLAPHAQNGVLSPQGLSSEFRNIAGEAVVSSLKGEEISLQEKAQARFNDLLTIEKNGEVVSGTQTQQTVARAQSMLDSGDIAGAIATLQTLDGQAAQTTAPFLEQAQATLLAQNVQNMLGSSLKLNGLDLGALADGLLNQNATGIITP